MSTFNTSSILVNTLSETDGNKGIQLIGRGEDGATFDTYNGGLASWYGIGFKCTDGGLTRFMFNTRTGDQTNTGNLTATKVYCDTLNLPATDGSLNYIGLRDNLGNGVLSSTMVYFSNSFHTFYASMQTSGVNGTVDGVLDLYRDGLFMTNGKNIYIGTTDLYITSVTNNAFEFYNKSTVSAGFSFISPNGGSFRKAALSLDISYTICEISSGTDANSNVIQIRGGYCNAAGTTADGIDIAQGAYGSIGIMGEEYIEFYESPRIVHILKNTCI